MAIDIKILEIIVGAGLAGLLLGYGLARISGARRLRELEQRLEERVSAEALEEQLSLRFENLANRIFEEKTDRFRKESQEGIGNLLLPLRERLQDFQKKIDESFGAQMRDSISLKEEIKRIVLTNEKMSLQTESLTRALKSDVKMQGNWGEVILGDILESTGLRKGEEYIVQGVGLGLKNEAGGALRPDVVVKLPDSRHIIIDAKVNLTAYERYCSTQDPAALAEHAEAMRRQIKLLSETRYQDNEKLGTPDFVLMFVPIEGAYVLALQTDPSLHAYAWERKIVIVSPPTLFATLRTVESTWRVDRQSKHWDEIAKRGGLLYDKLHGFVTDMQDLGGKLAAAQKVYDESFKKLSTGRGNVVSQAEELKALGVKTAKAMPRELLSDDELKKVENA